MNRQTSKSTFSPLARMVFWTTLFLGVSTVSFRLTEPSDGPCGKDWPVPHHSLLGTLPQPSRAPHSQATAPHCPSEPYTAPRSPASPVPLPVQHITAWHSASRIFCSLIVVTSEPSLPLQPVQCLFQCHKTQLNTHRSKD